MVAVVEGFDEQRGAVRLESVILTMNLGGRLLRRRGVEQFKKSASPFLFVDIVAYKEREGKRERGQERERERARERERERRNSGLE